MQIFTITTVWDYLEALAQEIGKPYLTMDISKAKMIERYNKQQEREQLKKEITEDVLSRISIMFETGEALEKVNALNKAINQLGEN